MPPRGPEGIREFLDTGTDFRGQGPDGQDPLNTCRHQGFPGCRDGAPARILES